MPLQFLRLGPPTVVGFALSSALGCSKPTSRPVTTLPQDDPAGESVEASSGRLGASSAALVVGGGGGDSPNAAGYAWRSVAIGGGGFVTGLIPSRSQRGLWYARTDVGGAYRYEASSRSWTPLTDWVSDEQTGFLGVESIALDPGASERVYLLVGISYWNEGKSAVLRSTDFGESFEVIEVTSQFRAHGNGMGRQSGEKLAVDPNQGRTLYAGTRAQGLFRSHDHGSTWQRLRGLDVTTTRNENGVAFVVVDPTQKLAGRSARIFVGVSRSDAPSLYVSTDAGESFRAVAGQPRDFTPQRAALSSQGSLFVTYANGPGPHPHETGSMDRGAIWKLDVKTGQWTEITPLRGEANRAFGGISVDATDPGRLLASTVNAWLPQPWGHGDRIFSSEDGGASWTDRLAAGRAKMESNGFPWIREHSIHWAGSVELDPFDAQRAFVTSGNGVFATDDLDASPSTWRFAVKGLEETVPLDAASLPGGPLVSVIGDYDGFVHEDLSSSPAGGRHRPNVGTTRSLAVAAKKPSVLARSGSQLFLSQDGGASWSQIPRPSEHEGGHVALSADAGVLLWSAGSVTHRSGDSGRAWQRVRGLDFDATIVADAVDSGRFYAYDPDTGGFFASRDSGASFAKVASLEPGGAARIAAVPGMPAGVWVALREAGLVRTEDGGRSFEVVSSLARCAAVGFGVSASGKGFPAVYAWGAPDGEPSGVYRSDDRGASWLRINDDAHQYGGPGNGQFVIGDANEYGRVYLSTAGRGIAYGTLTSAATRADESE